MTLSAAYATPAQYRTVVGKTDTADDADILTDLTAISRFLEARLGRFFNRDATAVVRMYLPQRDTQTLTVDDLSDVPTAVAVDARNDGTFSAALIMPRDYELLPHNAALGPEPQPWTQIRLLHSGILGVFPVGVRVRVTARFGWPAVPVAVQRATIHLAAILRLETPRATRRISELTETVETSPDAQRIVRQLTDQYKLERYV